MWSGAGPWPARPGRWCGGGLGVGAGLVPAMRGGGSTTRSERGRNSGWAALAAGPRETRLRVGPGSGRSGETRRPSFCLASPLCPIEYRQPSVVRPWMVTEPGPEPRRWPAVRSRRWVSVRVRFKGLGLRAGIAGAPSLAFCPGCCVSALVRVGAQEGLGVAAVSELHSRCVTSGCGTGT